MSSRFTRVASSLPILFLRGGKISPGQANNVYLLGKPTLTKKNRRFVNARMPEAKEGGEEGRGEIGR